MPKNVSFGKLKQLVKRYSLNVRKQAGFGLVESLLAVAIMGSTVFMLLGGLSTGAISVGILQEDIIAENLGRTQLEYTKSLPFTIAPFSYESVEEVPDGYSITAEAIPVTSRNDNIQRLVITIYHGDKFVYILEGFKVNR
ncbi:MAG: hypothetical protein JSU79_08175 [Dehalococcoidales bacterium]|nr:MAG: hypothetical protein JSU79_08175 [Dehalococcoidales bacterium]